MDKKRLFNFIKKQKKADIIDLLEAAYNEMDTRQRSSVFSGLLKDSDSKNLLDDVKMFYQDSIDGYYYAPFNINSKNFMYIPAETEKWFQKLSDYLEQCTNISKQGNHQLALTCFNILYELIDKMEDGDEIVFADEYGTWMIPGDEKIFIASYITSASKILKTKEFVETVIPIIKRDSYQSFSLKAYETAINIANSEQKKLLEAEIKNQKIRVKR